MSKIAIVHTDKDHPDDQCFVLFHNEIEFMGFRRLTRISSGHVITPDNEEGWSSHFIDNDLNRLGGRSAATCIRVPTEGTLTTHIAALLTENNYSCLIRE